MSLVKEFFVVWNGERSFQDFPTVPHGSQECAEREAYRLAQKHPTRTFSVLGLRSSYTASVKVSRSEASNYPVSTECGCANRRSGQ